MRWRKVKKKEGLSPLCSPKTVVIAPISLRLKAFIIDSFMLLMPILYTAFYLIFGSRENFALHKVEGWIFILLSYFVLTTLFLWRKGKTPGYKAYDIKLVDTLSQQTPSFFKIVVRYLIWVMVCATLLGLLLPFFRKDKRSIPDIVSHSVPICA